MGDLSRGLLTDLQGGIATSRRFQLISPVRNSLPVRRARHYGTFWSRATLSEAFIEGERAQRGRS
jgi:hypothetical protein